MFNPETTPKHVTKFCAPDFFEPTLRGHLRIGTLEEFRNWEGGEPRLRDADEGMFADVVPDDVLSASMRIDGMTLNNVSFTGGTKGAFKVVTYYHALIYCVTSGAFNPNVHAAFVREGNASLSCYVVFDARKLFETLVHAIGHCRSGEGYFLCRDVDYVDEKSRDQSVPQLKAQYDQATGEAVDPMEQLTNAVFRKPLRFAYEREIRLAAIFHKSRSEQPILLKDIPPQFADRARSAIVASGKV